MATDLNLLEQPVAILIGPQTASAGEATTLALASRDRTRFFGEPTSGTATGPTYLHMYDGALLSLATAWMVGPQGAIYPEGIAPDVVVSPSDVVHPLADDPVVQEASKWLHEQPDCEPSAATPAS